MKISEVSNDVSATEVTLTVSWTFCMIPLRGVLSRLRSPRGQQRTSQGNYSCWGRTHDSLHPWKQNFPETKQIAVLMGNYTPRMCSFHSVYLLVVCVCDSGDAGSFCLRLKRWGKGTSRDREDKRAQDNAWYELKRTCEPMNFLKPSMGYQPVGIVFSQ